MPESSTLYRRWILISVLVVIIAGAITATVTAARNTSPLAVPVHYPLDMLAEEAGTMVECAECHDAEAFHTCDTCHDDHGAIELEGVPFYAMVSFTGDVPDPGYVTIDEILPYQEQPHTHLPLVEFLARQGVEDFESVTMVSDDQGFITVAADQLTEEAWLLPYEDGIRFASEDLHVSAWIKGITRFIVVGEETPLTIDGEPTSMGRLLLGPTRSVTVEETTVMLKSEDDGAIREAKTASRVEGVPLNPGESIIVKDAIGETHTVTGDDAQGALLALIRGEVTLVLPGRGRSEWISGVVEVTTESE
jgi:hypothetical protein